MKIQWLQQTSNKEEREKLKKTILASQYTLSILEDIVCGLYADSLDIFEKDYDESSSWAYKQAHLNGKREAFTQVLALLELNPREKEDDKKPLTRKKKALTDAIRTTKR